MTNDDEPTVTIHRLPSLVPTHAHTAYLNGHITRQEWLLLTDLHYASIKARLASSAAALEHSPTCTHDEGHCSCGGASSSSSGRARGAPPA